MENAIDIKFKDEALVVQANEIIRAKKDDLTILEAKLIFLAISQISQEDNDLFTYSCAVTDLARFLEIPQDNIYRDIDELTTNIMGKLIYLIDKSKSKKRNGKPNYQKIPWVDYCSYIDGVITIRISDKLKPYIMGLNSYLTRYGYYCIKPLPTSTTISLFNLLSSYESLTNPYSVHPPANLFPHIPREKYELIFSIDYLKEYFNCQDKYSLTADFIKRVIDISVRGINKKSPTMKVSYRTAKEGRKIGYVLFKINAWDDEEFKEFILKQLD